MSGKAGWSGLAGRAGGGRVLMSLGWVEASSPVLSIAGKEQSSRSQRMAGGMETGDWRERREMTGW